MCDWRFRMYVVYELLAHKDRGDDASPLSAINGERHSHHGEAVLLTFCDEYGKQWRRSSYTLSYIQNSPLLVHIFRD